MNLYFLVEGTTESEFYPKFVDKYFENKIQRVDEYGLAVSNNFYLIGCDGYPYIFTGSNLPDYNVTALKSAILEINDNPVYDYLIVCLDADEETVQDKINEFEQYVKKYELEGVILNKYCKFQLIVQNRCIETWFLGNKKMYPTNPNNEPLISYSRYYNVKINDPEKMGNYGKEFTHQDFHLQYLRKMLQEKRKTYKKIGLINSITEPQYLEQIVKRAKSKENHLQTFKEFLKFCEDLKSRIIV